MKNTAAEKEQKLLQKAAAEFARKALLPERESHDHYPFGEFFTDALEQAYDLGFFHTLLPEELDGLGRAVTPLCTLLTSLCATDASMGGIMLTNAAAQEILLNAGALDLAGERTAADNGQMASLTAFQLFAHPQEPGSALQVRAAGGKELVSGTCEYVVLGGLADMAVLPVEKQGEDGFTYYLVDLADKNVEKSDPVVSLGLRACPAVDLRLADAPARRIGNAGAGLGYFETTADRLNAALAATAVGLMQASFSEALAYCRKRVQGGRAVVKWTEVQMMLADMAYKLDAAGILARQACRATDDGTRGWEQTGRTAALYTQDLACQLISDGVQLLGGYGYTKDYGQEKYFRDTKQLQAAFGLAPMKKLRYLNKFYRL